MKTRLVAIVICAVGVVSVAAAQSTKPLVDVKCDPASGIARTGQAISWTVAAPPATMLRYRLKLNNLKIIDEGVIPLERVVRAKLDSPGWLLLEITDAGDQLSKPLCTAGAVVDSGQIRSDIPQPDDFQQFWSSQIGLVSKVQPNPVLKPQSSGRADVEYQEVVLDNVDGKHVHAQLARPVSGTRFPALVIFQWAGVYPMAKEWVTGPASSGWLVLNVSAHDLPLHESAAFYQARLDGDLRDYAWIGATSRDSSYFRTMLLGDYQALTYLATRADWDGKTLVVKGGSQGGMQAIILASLCPKVSALIAAVPAGCDTLGQRAGHQPGWPYWFKAGAMDAHADIMQCSRYFDAIHFASRVNCPALVCLGLRDTTSPPPGVLCMYSELAGPKELIINPAAAHPDPQPQFEHRAAQWLDCLRETGHPPITN